MIKNTFRSLLVLYTLLFIAIIELCAQNKGTAYFYWGYNRAQFTKSDIRVWGTGYDFTLFDVRAKDRPTRDFKTYFDLSQFSVPQFVVRAGFYLTDKLHISGGYDHMKYVVEQHQNVSISGEIETSVSGQYYGVYHNSNITISPDFFLFEHTNGLNYLSLEVDWQENLWKSKNEKFRFNMKGGIGLGIIYPRSEVILFNIKGADLFCVAGYGTNLHIAMKLDMGRYFFLRSGLKGGFINMPNVLTYDLPNHGASHKFWFLQEYACFGFQYNFYNLFCKDKLKKE